MTPAELDVLEAALLDYGKLELQLQHQLLMIPQEIRRLAMAGNEEKADALDAVHTKLRAELDQVRIHIRKIEAKLYPARRR